MNLDEHLIHQASEIEDRVVLDRLKDVRSDREMMILLMAEYPNFLIRMMKLWTQGMGSEEGQEMAENFIEKVREIRDVTQEGIEAIEHD
jgi:hypothetical protein